jgi:hypothetical protein
MIKTLKNVHTLTHTHTYKTNDKIEGIHCILLKKSQRTNTVNISS